MSTDDTTRQRTGILRRLRHAGSKSTKPLSSSIMNPYQSIFYDVANLLLRFLLRLIATIEISGTTYVPRHGQLIVSGNHTSWLDPLLVGAFVPRRIVFMSKKENLANPCLLYTSDAADE